MVNINMEKWKRDEKEEVRGKEEDRWNAFVFDKKCSVVINKEKRRGKLIKSMINFDVNHSLFSR